MRLRPAEFAPDQATLSEFIEYILNCVPFSQQSYGPVGELGEVGNALTGQCLGAGSFRGSGGTVLNVAADDNTLYSWNGTSWSDVMPVSVSLDVATDDKVTFSQFGDRVVMLNGTDAPLKWDIGTSSTFEAMTASSGSVPNARFATTVRDFFVVGRVAGNLNRVQWPDINSTEAWGAGQASSQDLPNGGRVMGIVGGEYGRIWSETAITAMTYVGPPDIFQFDPLSLERGCDAEGSIAAYQGSVFFHAQDGFWLMNADGGLTPIGDQKIDRWFDQRVDKSYIYNIVSAIDPVAKIYYVAYPTLLDGTGRCTEMLAYAWAIGRWSVIDVDIDYIFGARTNLGYTLETLDTLYPNLDLMPISLDSNLLTGSTNQTLAVFTQNKKMAFFGSTPMTAYIDTAEGDLSEGHRTFLQGVRPLFSGTGSASVKIGSRNLQNESLSWGQDVAQNAFGRCPFRSQARYHRARVTLSGQWEKFMGVDIEGKKAGKR